MQINLHVFMEKCHSNPKPPGKIKDSATLEAKFFYPLSDVSTKFASILSAQMPCEYYTDENGGTYNHRQLEQNFFNGLRRGQRQFHEVVNLIREHGEAVGGRGTAQEHIQPAEFFQKALHTRIQAQQKSIKDSSEDDSKQSLNELLELPPALLTQLCEDPPNLLPNARFLKLVDLLFKNTTKSSNENFMQRWERAIKPLQTQTEYLDYIMQHRIDTSNTSLATCQPPHLTTIIPIENNPAPPPAQHPQLPEFHVGIVLRKLREVKGFSVDALQRAAYPYSRQDDSISKIEKGTRLLQYNKVSDIITALGLNQTAAQILWKAKSLATEIQKARRKPASDQNRNFQQEVNDLLNQLEAHTLTPTPQANMPNAVQADTSNAARVPDHPAIIKTEAEYASCKPTSNVTPDSAHSAIISSQSPRLG